VTPRRPAAAARAVVRKILSDPDRRRRVPGTSERFGPPRRHAPSTAMAGTPGVRTTVVALAAPPARPRTIWHGRDGAARFAALARAGVPPQTVNTIADARVVCPHGWVIGPGDTLVTDLLFGWERPRQREVQRLAHARTAEVLPGRTLALLSDWASTNWSHFLLDAMARRYLVERAGIDLSTVDRVLVPGLTSPTARFFLDTTLGGVPVVPVPAEDERTLRCEELIVASYPGTANNLAPWTGPYLRSLVPERLRQGAGAPILLVRRGGVRALLDEEELAVACAAQGMAVIEAGRGEADVAAFATAPLVVAPHGAGMANLAFCTPGTLVLELFPPGHEIPVFASLSASAGLEHHGMVGEPGPTGGANPHWDPWHVDVPSVMQVVDRLLDRARATARARTAEQVRAHDGIGRDLGRRTMPGSAVPDGQGLGLGPGDAQMPWVTRVSTAIPRNNNVT
jgi:capsular polysaccharide biosynthesis protein